MDSERPISVAIVGSGMAGLVTAYLLNRDPHKRYQVKLFESGSFLSLDSASVSVPNASRSSSHRVDLPMRAFAGGYYNNLKSMYSHLGIQYHNQPFLFEFAKVAARPGDRCDSAGSYFIHASNLHKLPPRPSAIATILYWQEVVYLLACYAWFSVCCFFVAPTSTGSYGAETLDEYLRRVWLPKYFIMYYLLPLISSVTTCSHEALLRFPAIDLIDYKRRTHRAPHYTVSNGVKTVQERLVDGINIEFSALVKALDPQEDQVVLSWKKVGEGHDDVHQETFNRVVLAVTPDIVGEIFQPLRLFMARIPTARVESVVHTDRGPLPKGDDHIGPSVIGKTQLIYLRTSTIGVTRTESLHVQPGGSIVTTCPFTPLDPALMIHSAKFTRVLRSPESRCIVNSIFGDTPHVSRNEKAEIHWKNGDNNVWLVGGWCWDGMVLLEGCIVSAMRVADAFDVQVPWRH